MEREGNQLRVRVRRCWRHWFAPERQGRDGAGSRWSTSRRAIADDTALTAHAVFGDVLYQVYGQTRPFHT